MKKLIPLFLLAALTILPQAQANEETKSPIFLSNCSHYGPGVSYSFQSCVNSNFSAIDRVLGGFALNCMNIGKEVSYAFTSCVNANFRQVELKLEGNVWLQDCVNFDRTNLEYMFISCVNSNFKKIEREISVNH